MKIAGKIFDQSEEHAQRYAMLIGEGLLHQNKRPVIVVLDGAHRM
jgi:hypothetical protein